MMRLFGQKGAYVLVAFCPDAYSVYCFIRRMMSLLSCSTS